MTGSGRPPGGDGTRRRPEAGAPVPGRPVERSGRRAGPDGGREGGSGRVRRPVPGGAPERLGTIGAASATAARTPFVVLVVTLLAGGLISLLLLNSAVNRDSFQLNKLQKDTTGYTDEQQQLQQEVDGYSAPGELERRARELGMVPGDNPAFLNPDGTVHGRPDEATAPPTPTATPTATATPTPPTPPTSPASPTPPTSPASPTPTTPTPPTSTTP